MEKNLMLRHLYGYPFYSGLDHYSVSWIDHIKLKRSRRALTVITRGLRNILAIFKVKKVQDLLSMNFIHFLENESVSIEEITLTQEKIGKMLLGEREYHRQHKALAIELGDYDKLLHSHLFMGFLGNRIDSEFFGKLKTDNLELYVTTHSLLRGEGITTVQEVLNQEYSSRKLRRKKTRIELLNAIMPLFWEMKSAMVKYRGKTPIHDANMYEYYPFWNEWRSTPFHYPGGVDILQVPLSDLIFFDGRKFHEYFQGSPPLRTLKDILQRRPEDIPALQKLSRRERASIQDSVSLAFGGEVKIMVQEKFDQYIADTLRREMDQYYPSMYSTIILLKLSYGINENLTVAEMARKVKASPLTVSSRIKRYCFSWQRGEMKPLIKYIRDTYLVVSKARLLNDLEKYKQWNVTNRVFFYNLFNYLENDGADFCWKGQFVFGCSQKEAAALLRIAKALVAKQLAEKPEGIPLKSMVSFLKSRLHTKYTNIDGSDCTDLLMAVIAGKTKVILRHETIMRIGRKRRS